MELFSFFFCEVEWMLRNQTKALCHKSQKDGDGYSLENDMGTNMPL